MRGCLALVAVVAGCYSPTPHEGAPCAANGSCPEPLHCSLDRCVLTDPITDAAPADTMSNDGPVTDAATDAPAMCSTAGLTCSGTRSYSYCQNASGTFCISTCTQQVTHDVAQNACTGWGGTLAVLDSAAAEACTMNTVDSWIGLEQPMTAQTPGAGWTWNGTTAVTYTNWAPNQPNDSDGIEDQTEQCGYRRISDGAWHDISCTLTYGFACRR
ncbi:hypothetical protein BH11MYX3_BH11MYX3_33910 [soil metagenome]